MSKIKIVPAFLLLFVFTACTSAWSWLYSDETILSAHRGAQVFAPENTVAAIKWAAKKNYSAIEIDPRMSKDGEIFLMHDDTIDRTTNGSGAIENLNSSEIKKLKIRTDQYEEYKSQLMRVPTFEQAVKEAGKSSLIINVDCSKGDWLNESFDKKIISTLKKHNMFENSFFVLSKEQERDFFNKLFPEACISWLVDPNASIEKEIEKAQTYNHALLSISNDLATPENIKKLNESNVYYQVYGVNDSARLKELKVEKVKMVETDMLVP